MYTFQSLSFFRNFITSNRYWCNNQNWEIPDQVQKISFEYCKSMFKECNFSRIPIVQPGNEKVMLSLSLSIYRWLEAIYHQTLGKYYILMLYLQKTTIRYDLWIQWEKRNWNPWKRTQIFSQSKKISGLLANLGNDMFNTTCINNSHDLITGQRIMSSELSTLNIQERHGTKMSLDIRSLKEVGSSCWIKQHFVCKIEPTVDQRNGGPTY